MHRRPEKNPAKKKDDDRKKDNAKKKDGDRKKDDAKKKDDDKKPDDDRKKDPEFMKAYLSFCHDLYEQGLIDRCTQRE